MERKVLTEVKALGDRRVEAIIAMLDAVDGHGDAYGEAPFDVNSSLVLEPIEHGTALKRQAPVGSAILTVDGNAVKVKGKYLPTPEGEAEYQRVLKAGTKGQWSYWYEPRELGELTPDLEAKGAKRVLAKVEVHAAGLVMEGACGGACHTTGVKCAGACSCKPAPQKAAKIEPNRLLCLSCGHYLGESTQPLLNIGVVEAKGKRDYEILAEINRVAGLPRDVRLCKSKQCGKFNVYIPRSVIRAA